MADSLIFDRVTVDSVVGARALGDGAAFNVRVRNVGEGCQETQVVRAEVSGTAIACLGAKGRSVEDWLARNVARKANTHKNDGKKLRALAEAGSLRFDSLHVLD